MVENIHWYPGHIAKAERELKEKIKQIDLVLEIVDARAPHSSRYQNLEKLINTKPKIVILNKKDKADPKKNIQWKNRIEEKENVPCILTCARENKDKKIIIDAILKSSEPIFEKLKQKGLIKRPVRVMVIGMPNVGKSSVINKITGSSKAKTGEIAGVTRNQQWVRIHKMIELLDTPGIIPTALVNQENAIKLAIINSISKNAYDVEFVSAKLLEILKQKYQGKLNSYYGFLEDEDITIETIAIKRNWIIKEKMPDIKRCAQFILTNFRDCKIGNFTLDEPEDF